MFNLLSFVLAVSLSAAAKAQVVVNLPIINGIIAPDGYVRP
jgi:hypothetical protein